MNNEQIEIYWWNGRKKTLDFSGSYRGFFKEKGIIVRKLPNKNQIKYRFKIQWSNCNAVFDIYSHKEDAYREAIKIFLTVLGDKTIFFDHYSRPHKLNWN